MGSEDRPGPTRHRKGRGQTLNMDSPSTSSSDCCSRTLHRGVPGGGCQWGLARLYRRQRCVLAWKRHLSLACPVSAWKAQAGDPPARLPGSVGCALGRLGTCCCPCRCALMHYLAGRCGCMLLATPGAVRWLQMQVA